MIIKLTNVYLHVYGLGLGGLFRNNFENNRRGLKLGNNCINWGIIGANYIDQ